MPFAYYDRLSRRASASIARATRSTRSRCRPAWRRRATSQAIRAALVADDRAAVQRALPADLVDALAAGYRVPPIRVRVLAQRPADDYGELHGLYEPEERAHAGAHHRLDAHRAAAGRSSRSGRFLRTVVHELCHHLDYELFELAETFHTEGFYKRESSLANALFASEREHGPHSPDTTGDRASEAGAVVLIAY